MQLLQKLPTETHITKSGRSNLRSYGIFFCPSCNTEVKKETTIGHRAKCCGKTECRTKAGFGHGFHNTPIYFVWNAMKKRCDNPNDVKYHRYGGRGISYPEKWKSFLGFYEDMGDTFKKGLTIDRKDNDKSYSKSNCEWITKSENSAKDKRKLVKQMDKAGNLVAAHVSIKAVSENSNNEFTRTSVGRAIKQGTPYRGFYWEFA